MKFLEKEMTIDKRQDWDFLFWIILLLLGGTFIYSVAVKDIMLVILICIGIIFFGRLMHTNTKIALNQMKKEKECQKSKAKIKVS